MSCNVRWRWTHASWCTEIQLAPASAKAGMNSSACSIIRWQSRMALGRAFLSDATTSGPIVIFGTKWPSITSTWSTVPPPSSAAFASSPRRAKFAERIEGASSMIMGSGPLLPFSRENRLYAEVLRSSLKSVIRKRIRASPRNRTAFLAALAREFEHAHDVQRAFGSHGQRRASEDGVAHIRIVVAVIAGSRWNAPLFERISRGDGEDAPILFRLGAPCRVRRDIATPEIRLLGIECLFHETGLRAEKNEAGTRCGGEDAGSKNRAHAIRIVQSNIKGIVGGGVFTLHSNVGGYGFRQTEEEQGVIDQVRRNVE